MGFAQGVRRDLSAVEAGLTLDWGQGTGVKDSPKVRRFGTREIPLERRQGCEQKTLRTPAHLVGKPNEDHSRP